VIGQARSGFRFSKTDARTIILSDLTERTIGPDSAQGS
jgi:hypothetical protein